MAPLARRGHPGSHCHQGQDLDTHTPSHPISSSKYPKGITSFQVLMQENQEATWQSLPLETIKMGKGEAGTRKLPLPVPVEAIEVLFI